MKITSNNLLVDLVGFLKDTGETVKDKTQPKETDAGTGGDTVETSGRSLETQQVRDAIDSIKDLREEKVEELRVAVQTGTYDVNGEEVAQSILEESIINTVL